ncbi:hypothetical protein D9M71_804780 [compost metagenome]
MRAQQTWDRAFACNIAEAHGDGGPLVVGIIGRGHLEYGHGTPYQLADLGLTEVEVLLPSDTPQVTPAQRDIAAAIYRLPPVEHAVAKRKQEET